jgi:Lon protease-like protein
VSDPAPELVPLFPLNLVAFPGMSVPLHVFEERYCALVRHLLQLAEPTERVFAIVAIREGYEVGNHEARSMYRTGCLVQLAEVEPYADGRFDIVAVGRQRVRVVGTEASAPFLRAELERLDSRAEPDPDTAREAARALTVFGDYRAAVSELRGDEVMTGPLPRDPEMLSYVLASTCSLTLPERQQLLESPTPGERLGLLRRLMRRELQAIAAIPSLPATEVARTGWNPN